MSEELVRKAFTAFNAHDAEAWAEIMTPDGTFTSAYWGIDGRTYGRDQLADYFQQMGEQWDEFTMEIVRIEEGKGEAVAIATFHATEPGTQVAVAPEQALFFKFEGDKVASIVTIPNVQEALEQLS
jgi:uncharacterized protein (TIGR02246 family)